MFSYILKVRRLFDVPDPPFQLTEGVTDHSMHIGEFDDAFIKSFSSIASWTIDPQPQFLTHLYRYTQATIRCTITWLDKGRCVVDVNVYEVVVCFIRPNPSKIMIRNVDV